MRMIESTFHFIKLEVINKLNSKVCKICNKNEPSNEFYKNKANKDGLHSYCKKCVIEKSRINNQKNPEKHRESRRKAESTEHGKSVKRKMNEKIRKEGKYRKWQSENRNKIKEYNEKWKFHKSHDISNEELDMIYEYTNNSCMYCGMTEADSIQEFNQKLHKDHAYNNGSDGIDNCVLACKSCNSSKHDKDWIEWFTTKDFYTEERFVMILDWLNMWK
jgi:hypothetical protein